MPPRLWRANFPQGPGLRQRAKLHVARTCRVPSHPLSAITMPIITSMPSKTSATATLAHATSLPHSLAAASRRHSARAGRMASCMTCFVQPRQHGAGPPCRLTAHTVILAHNTHRPAPADGTAKACAGDGASGTGDAEAHALRTGEIARNSARAGDCARNNDEAGGGRDRTGGGAGEAAGTTFGEACFMSS